MPARPPAGQCRRVGFDDHGGLPIDLREVGVGVGTAVAVLEAAGSAPGAAEALHEGIDPALVERVRPDLVPLAAAPATALVVDHRPDGYDREVADVRIVRPRAERRLA